MRMIDRRDGCGEFAQPSRCLGHVNAWRASCESHSTVGGASSRVVRRNCYSRPQENKAMPNVTIGFGAVLCAIGLFGYFGSASDNTSPTALIPLGFGVVLIICGLIARSPGARKHAMHAAAAVSLVGCIAAA